MPFSSFLTGISSLPDLVCSTGAYLQNKWTGVLETPTVQLYGFLFYHHVLILWSSFSSFFPRKAKMIEPDTKEWYYFGYYHTETQQLHHYYSEKYEEHTLGSYTSIVSPLWMVKKPNMYLSSIHSGVFFQPEKSDVSFLYVEYTCGNKSISLNISEEYMYIGNELFSPAFVLRLLEHQTEYYIFNCDYKINILDKTLITHRLSYYNYLILEKSQIQIRNRDHIYLEKIYLEK
jgi:hypothetical protein